MNKNDFKVYDLIILGGGCSGLALANALCKRHTKLKIAILEKRKHYENDRTWCFWATTDNPWFQFAEKTWSSWKYHHEQTDKSYKHNSNIWHYCYLSASKYYQHIINNINQNPNVQLFQDVDVEKCTQLEDELHLIQTKSGHFKGKCVVDTRTPKQMKSLLYQEFFGMEIYTRQPWEDSVWIMRNMRSDQTSFRFNYILPLSQHHLLFEHTRFNKHVTCKDILEQECLSELERLDIEFDHVLRQEHGVLPMGLKQNKSHREIKGGTSAGALRNSTGYGFLRIQKWAHRFADSLEEKNPKELETNFKEPSWQKWMDMLFLGVLHSHPERCADFFAQLAKNVPADSLVRFLSEHGTLLDCWKVIKSLPPTPFVKQLLFRNKVL